MASDAWATGQALYALAHAEIQSDEPVDRARPSIPDQDTTRRRLMADDVAAGQARGDGCKSLIPITGAGSAWATLGLVRSR